MRPQEEVYWEIWIARATEAELWGLMLRAAIAINGSSTKQAAKTLGIPYRRLLSICDGTEMSHSEAVAVKAYLLPLTRGLRFVGRQGRIEIGRRHQFREGDP